MRAIRILIPLGLCTVVLAGCANLPNVVKALSQDPATVCASLQTVYGTLKVARTNITNGDVACSGDGLTVKSAPANVPLNVTIAPAKAP
jgi:hypothetical protein